MAIRITTWNVNGIRNPFSYQPWRDKRSFAAMFDILEADIVVMQETKIQRKDLQDDMVLVPGWDCYFSLPKYKKGYSGVAIYTRQSVCAPIRAEEGITGVLCPPNSSTSYLDLPEDAQIGGYPSNDQLARFPIDSASLDSEGRCVILEFPAFVLIGLYSPANRDETRDDFRLGFINAFDARIRNLVTMGKRVVLTGDLNISREEIDSANAEEMMRKHGLSSAEYASTPARRIFNQLMIGGKVFGERDEGREMPVMWDVCRGFHEGRKGMFTCWEQKINARPGNFGSRIDYVLCSEMLQDWFCDSNIQEGLMGSDHCPVFAVLKEKVNIAGTQIDIRDLLNPAGTFADGKRMVEYSTKCILPLSGKLIPEFDKRRNIRDMFARKTSNQGKEPAEKIVGTKAVLASASRSCIEQASQATSTEQVRIAEGKDSELATKRPISSNATGTGRSSPIKVAGVKRAFDTSTHKTQRSPKRSKSVSSSNPPISSSKGQQNLKGFFKAKTRASNSDGISEGGPQVTKNAPDELQQQAIIMGEPITASLLEVDPSSSIPTSDVSGQEIARSEPQDPEADITMTSRSSSFHNGTIENENVVDPIVTKESWSQLFSKPVAPRCEGHKEPCISLTTKKPGVNCGRVFWICPRPVGPTGNKKNGTQWRCETFIWSSQWNGGVT